MSRQIPYKAAIVGRVSAAGGNRWWLLGDRQALYFPVHNTDWSRLGWACYFSETTLQAGAGVFVRFGMSSPDVPFSREQVTRAPLAVREVHMIGAADGTVARDLPIARMEAAANRRLLRATGNAPDIAKWYPFTLPPPSRKDEVYNAAPWSSGIPFGWAKFPGWEEPDASLSVAPSMKLTVPDDRRRPDSFYADVAELYQWLSSRTGRPAQEIASANGVPMTTVHGWVKEARRRGLMPRGQREPSEGGQA
jgi:hypothetical protein